MRPAGLIKAVRAALRIPLHILIRPRAGDFLYNAKELLVCPTMACCCCSSSLRWAHAHDACSRACFRWHAHLKPLALSLISSWAALQVMREDIMFAAELGADGVVAGVLTREGEIDTAQLSELLFLCRSLVRTPPLLNTLPMR